jgi:hypothetical protein
MNQLTQIKQMLEAVHPLAPWILLIPILIGANFLAIKFRVFIWLEAQYPWGSTPRAIMRAAPTVILGAAFDYLTTGSGDVGSIMTGAILGALVHYTPPKPPRGGAAVGLAALALAGCAPRSAPRVPTPTAEQAACVALAEAQKELEFRSCGANLDPPCGVNPIMDRRKAAGQACFKKGSP